VADQVARGPGLDPHAVATVGKRRRACARGADQVPGHDVGIAQEPHPRPAIAADQVAAPVGGCADLVGRAAGRDEHTGPGIRRGRHAIGQNSDQVARQRDVRGVERHARPAGPHQREAREQGAVAAGGETQSGPPAEVDRQLRRPCEARGRRAVDRDGVGDRRQGRGQRDGAGDREGDLVGPGIGVGLIDRRPQRPRPGIQEVGDCERGQERSRFEDLGPQGKRPATQAPRTRRAEKRGKWAHGRAFSKRPREGRENWIQAYHRPPPTSNVWFLWPARENDERTLNDHQRSLTTRSPARRRGSSASRRHAVFRFRRGRAVLRRRSRAFGQPQAQ